MKKLIYCKVFFEATHQWLNCDIDEVIYLKNEHRHIFNIKAYKTVFHNDRDIEFIVLKHNIEKYLINKFPDRKLKNLSCEMIAEDLIEKFDLVRCEVSEDGENGVILEV